MTIARSCIFVDGENFRHSLIKLFGNAFPKETYLPRHGEWEKFFDFLASSTYSSQRLRTYWYTVRDLLFSPGERNLDPAKLQEIIRDYGPPQFKQLLRLSQPAHLLSNLGFVVGEFAKDRERMEGRFRGWKAMEDWIALHCDSLEFRRVGSIRYSLYDGEFGSEKAIDVKLATDLLELRHSYDVAIIVSGDQDYVPAVQVIKDSGKKAVNVTFKTRGGRLLPGGAKALNLVCDRSLEITYVDMARFMRISAGTPASPPGAGISRATP